MNPSAKQASTKGAHFFSWETCGMFISFRATETLSILSLLNVILCWTFTSRTNIEIDLKKHATKSWIPASHPVHLQFQQIKPVCPTLRYQPLCKIGVKKLALSLFTWDSSEMFTFIIFVKVNPEQSLLHIKDTLKLIPKKATKSWKLTPRLVQSLLLKLGGEAWK